MNHLAINATIPSNQGFWCVRRTLRTMQENDGEGHAGFSIDDWGVTQRFAVDSIFKDALRWHKRR